MDIAYIFESFAGIGFAGSAYSPDYTPHSSIREI